MPKNVLANEKGWLPVGEEAAIAAKPDVILTNVDYIDDPAKEILERKNWEKYLRFKTKKYLPLIIDRALLPNHHMTKAFKANGKSHLSRSVQGFER